MDFSAQFFRLLTAFPRDSASSGLAVVFLRRMRRAQACRSPLPGPEPPVLTRFARRLILPVLYAHDALRCLQMRGGTSRPCHSSNSLCMLAVSRVLWAAAALRVAWGSNRSLPKQAVSNCAPGRSSCLRSAIVQGSNHRFRRSVLPTLRSSILTAPDDGAGEGRPPPSVPWPCSFCSSSHHRRRVGPLPLLFWRFPHACDHRCSVITAQRALASLKISCCVQKICSPPTEKKGKRTHCGGRLIS